ncbi:hypothetical protein MNR01_08030 [Lysobacter sp. S4-A87]|uniref:hypothetical protein n=1 Tax=Lysobacter sp. S4-A87 TaxID=2925843 RepID=UPI001F53309C|nr:hypothetical protein [Lysobacter sp. S4-A87]UNK50936.1 hypothetical protein MNR01_08030 [Lysobacter sp. S4-A87]
MLRSLLLGMLLVRAGLPAHAQDVPATAAEPASAGEATPETAAPAADLPVAEAPISVHVSASAVDAVGRQFVDAVREQLRESPDLALVEASNGARIRLKIATLDPDNDSARRTVYSVVVTVRPVDREVDVYWNNYVGLCGQARVQACARSIVEEAGAPAASLRTIIETTQGPAP